MAMAVSRRPLVVLAWLVAVQFATTRTIVSQPLSAVRRANLHGMSLVAGKGSDPDTFGTNRVYVLDSGAYAFHQAEICLQFHNNQTGSYPPSYHRLREVLLANKRLRNDTGCPSNFVCS